MAFTESKKSKNGYQALSAFPSIAPVGRRLLRASTYSLYNMYLSITHFSHYPNLLVPFSCVVAANLRDC